MFGSANRTGFNSFGANNSGNTATTGLFGNSGTGAFGSTNNASTTGGSAFGQTQANSGSLFGQSTAQQNPSGGLFGQSSTSSFGGAFGQPNNQAQTQAPAATSPFGQSSTTGSGLFNAAKPAGSAFGGFGTSAVQTSPFGAATTTSPGFGASGQNQGSAAVPFEPFTEKDTLKANAVNIYQNISSMPQYQGYSFEELRMQDYGQSRRYGNGAAAPGTGFNQTTSSSPFGSSTTQPTGAFGQTANTSPFGANNNTSGSGSLFGATNTNTNTSPFGAATTQSAGLFGKPATTGSNLFGASNAANTNNTNTFGSGSSPFGASATNNQTSVSPFGQPQAASTGFAFGANANNNTNQASAGMFGQQQNKPAFGGFGSTATSSTPAFGAPQQQSTSGNGLFGSSTNTASTPFGGNAAASSGSNGFSFGGANAQQQQQNKSPFGAFGNTASSAPAATGFGAQPSTPSLFGQSNTATTSNSTGGLFGGNNATSAPATTGGLFGAKPAQPTGGLFGQSNTTTNTTTPAAGGLFGQNTQQPGIGGGLFGSNNNNAANAAQPSGGLFGAKPAQTSGMFGSTPAAPTTTSGGLFGGNSATASTGFSSTTPAKPLFGGSLAPPTGTTGGLFSTQPAQNSSGSTGLFGQPAQPQNQGTSLFGQKPAAPSMFGSQPQQQQSLLASVDQNPYGINPLFQNSGNLVATPNASVNSQAGPGVTPLSGHSAASKWKSASTVFRLAPKPLFSPKPLYTSLGSPTASSPQPKETISEASNPVALPSNGSSSASATSQPSPTGSPTAVFSALTDDAILTSEAFSPRDTVRRLIISRRLGPNWSLDEITTVSSPGTIEAAMPDTPPTPSPNGIVKATAPATASTSPEPALSISKETASNGSRKQPPVPKDEDIVDENGYWISPSQDKLQHMSLRELEQVRNFTVGRKNIGFVRFDEPVDLTPFSDAAKQIPGHLVILAKRGCVIYPSEEQRPPPGKGLNVKSTVTLHQVWVLSKDTREPIRDPAHPLYVKHLKRLKSIPGTEFTSWDRETGTWVFRVVSLS